MNWQKRHRAINVTVALAVATILTVAFLPQLALAISQTWYITDSTSAAGYVMQRGSSGGGSTAITVGAGASVIWVADEAASIPVSFPTGNWTGQIKATPDSSTHGATVEIGSWNGTAFSSAGTSGTMTFPTKGVTSTQSFTITDASAFDVSQGSWLALRFNNLVGNKTIAVATDNASYVSSPSTDPGYPSPWESYREAAHTTVWGTLDYAYNSTYDTAYMYGAGFTPGQSYAIGFYDHLGDKVGSDVSGSLSGTELSAEFPLNIDPEATAGIWHAVVFDTAEGTPSANYTDNISDALGYVIEDDFEVGASAIPEFPTVIAAIGVTGLCFGIYYWMRKRVRRVRRVYRVES